MAELNLPDDLFWGLVLAWKYPGQKDFDVSCAEQRQGFTLDLPLAEKEQQGHQDKGDMVIPSLPTPRLVLIQACFVLGFLERAFHPVALPLKVDEPLKRDRERSIAETEL